MDKCKAKIYRCGELGREGHRLASLGIFCVYHADYIEKIKKKINELQEELRKLE